jgi:flagellar biosynthesis/type III secretory pathway protein FliH
VQRLAEVSHRTYIRQAVRDKGENEAELSKDVHPHDLERAEDTVKELEQLGLWPPGTKSGTN